jgi:hypothetical protein
MSIINTGLLEKGLKSSFFARFDATKTHFGDLTTAIGPNLAVLENVWESVELVEIVPVTRWRLTMDLRKSTDIRIITSEDRQGIAWLGGNLTSDTTGGTGTFAAADVQNQVRDNLRDDDIKREGRTVREQIIRPIVAFGFHGRDVPVPYFRRVKPQTIDRIKEAELMYKAQHIGMDVAESWARERLGIPKPKVDENGQREAVLESPDAFEDGIKEGF